MGPCAFLLANPNGGAPAVRRDWTAFLAGECRPKALTAEMRVRAYTSFMAVFWFGWRARACGGENCVLVGCGWCEVMCGGWSGAERLVGRWAKIPSQRSTISNIETKDRGQEYIHLTCIDFLPSGRRPDRLETAVCVLCRVVFPKAFRRHRNVGTLHWKEIR